MAYRLESLIIDAIEEMNGRDEKACAWVQLAMGFAKESSDYHPQVRIAVGVSYSDATTVREIHESAVNEARELLADAAQVLQAHDLDELRAITREADAA